MNMHITSFLILCRPENRHSVRAATAALPGVEIHYCGDNGKIVAVAESASESHITDALQTLQSMPGVVAANLMYHGVEEADVEEDAAEENSKGETGVG